MIPVEAVEAAAKAAYESTMEEGDTPWEHFGGSSYLDYFRDHARAALEAAMPQLMGQAWDDGATTGWKQSGEGWNAEYPDESTGNSDSNVADVSGAPVTAQDEKALGEALNSI